MNDFNVDGCCQAWLRRNVTGPAHVAIARAGAAASIVLLKARLLP